LLRIIKWHYVGSTVSHPENPTRQRLIAPSLGIAFLPVTAARVTGIEGGQARLARAYGKNRLRRPLHARGPRSRRIGRWSIEGDAGRPSRTTLPAGRGQPRAFPRPWRRFLGAGKGQGCPRRERRTTTHFYSLGGGKRPAWASLPRCKARGAQKRVGLAIRI